jgi:hypothetical protein
MLNNYLSHAVVQLLSKDVDYDYCCKRLSQIHRHDKQLALDIIRDALTDARDVREIIPYLLDDLSTIEDNIRRN